MIVAAWNNGSLSESGAGYGIKVHEKDKKRYFSASHKEVVIELEETGECAVIKHGNGKFWIASRGELVHKSIGKWMLGAGIAPWEKGHPPKLTLIHLEENRYRLYR